MPQNDTPRVILAFLLTVSVVGGIFLLVNRAINPSQFEQAKDPALLSTQSSDQPGKSFVEMRNVPTGLFNYGGSTTWATIRRDVDPAVQTVWTGFKLRYTNPIQGAPGSTIGIRMLIDGQLSFAQSSRSVKDTEQQQAKARGFNLKEVPIALDGIAVAVHPILKVPGLTIAQLADIYTGKITNWNQVGGPDATIVALSRRQGESGTIDFFIENVLQNRSFGNNIQFVSTTTEAVRQVAINPNAIYYASAPEIVDQCSVKALPLARNSNEFVSPYRDSQAPNLPCTPERNQLNIDAFQTDRYPLIRRLFVVIKQNGQADEQAGEAYANLLLTNQGQELVAKGGFVRLR